MREIYNDRTQEFINYKKKLVIIPSCVLRYEEWAMCVSLSIFGVHVVQVTFFSNDLKELTTLDHTFSGF